MTLKIQDFIDIEQFQLLQDRLNEIYSFPSAIIDNDGNVLTSTAWQDICTKFHRQNSESAKECLKSDRYITGHLHEANPAVSYRCPHGLIDNAAPIIIDGVHYGNFFTGQFFLEPPDLNFFRAQARRYGFDEEAYIAAVQKVPIWTREKLNSYLFFIKGLIEVIAGIGLKNLREIENRKTMQESQERFRSILHTAMDGFWLVDLQGRLLEVNEAYCRMSGYGEQELLAMGISDLEASETPENTAAHVKKIMARGEDRFESRHRRRDGSIFDVEVSVQYQGAEGGRFVVFLRDITGRKQAEQEKQALQERLQRAEKMEALGQLAGGVAHDLNNVLGMLSGYSEILLEELPEGQPARGYAERILQSTEKGAAIIEDLLTLSRRGVAASEVINLNSVVSDFLKAPVLERIAAWHPRVTFTAECDKNLLNITGSRIHLEKTLMNLVSNAAEAISGKGQVRIGTESRYLDKPVQGYDEVTEGEYAVLTVTDTGTGISAQDREKIFEPFYTKKTMGRSGTGLGLAIVWGTVKDHNGYIDVLTQSGEGTTFTLYFPVTRQELSAQEPRLHIDQYRGSGESVLVVDDMAGQRDIAAALLGRLGYVVHAVAGGLEAVEYLKEHTVDILVLDMIMDPGLDGLETYQRVLEINPRQKAILVSGFSETGRVKAAKELGAGAYVKKPYMLETIGVALRDELGRQPAGEGRRSEAGGDA